MADSKKALFTFGIVSDIQYADSDDAWNYAKTFMRYYRGALDKLAICVQSWNALARPLDFALQLGDLLDGRCRYNKGQHIAVERLLEVFSRFKPPLYHIWGNHEFYNFTREELFKMPLNTNPDKDSDKAYYSFSPFPGFKFLVCDHYEISKLGIPPTHPNSVRASEYMAINKNEDGNDPNELVGLDRRFVAFNGALSEGQLEWIERELADADSKEEKVVLLGHLAIEPASTDPLCLLWNYEELLAILRAHKSAVMILGGHDHPGGYAQDEAGIHYVVVPAIVESPKDGNAFGHMEMFADCAVLHGTGSLLSREMVFRTK